MAAYPEYSVGFSDHTIGVEIPLAAVAIGACLIEKHFTLDKNMEGWDHKVSATKDELALIINGSKRINDALGSYRVTATESKEKIAEFRRSIVITRNMKAGDVLTLEDIDYKRPGTGISPELTDFIVGMAINKDLASDYILTQADFL